MQAGDVVFYHPLKVGYVQAAYQDDQGRTVCAVQDARDVVRFHQPRYLTEGEYRAINDPALEQRKQHILQGYNKKVQKELNESIQAFLDNPVPEQEAHECYTQFKRGQFIHWAEWRGVIVRAMHGEQGTVLEIYWAKNAMQRQGTEFLALSPNVLPVHSTREAFMAELMELHMKRMLDVQRVLDGVCRAPVEPDTRLRLPVIEVDAIDEFSYEWELYQWK